MKKVIISLFVILLLVGCSSNGGAFDGLSESQLATLQEAGITEEAFAAMPKEKQEALMDELGMITGDNEQVNKPNPEKETIDNVSQGGNYVVTVGDSMLWNYVELHYQDGKLVKIYMSFQKNDLRSGFSYKWTQFFIIFYTYIQFIKIFFVFDSPNQDSIGITKVKKTLRRIAFYFNLHITFQILHQF